MTARCRGTLLAGIVLVSTPLLAGFASTEVFLPAVGRIAGNGGAQFFTTVWATNLTGVPETFKLEFLKQGQANGSPASFQDTLQPGETKVYENVVETKLGLNSAIGAARVTSSGEIFVSERIFDQAPGADLGDTQGLFFAGVPKTFSISIGQSASIQGLNQGGAENFRYNFALVETGGGSPTVNVQVFDGSGGQLGQKSFTLSPFEQLQPNVSEVVPGFSSINARLTATVTGGSGSVLLAGAQLANISQDSSGFEMSFRDDLLGAGAGVTSLNGLAGALTLTPGNGISITPSGSSIAIAFTGGGGSGLTSVTHDVSLTGAGTGASPLAIANGQVVRSLNGLHDAVTLAAGSNVTITPSGNTLTIASTGSGTGGLAAVSHDSTLAGEGTGASPLGVAVPLTLSASFNSNGVLTVINSGADDAIDATADDNAVFGFSDTGTGLSGQANSGDGVDGFSRSGNGINAGTQTGFAGVSASNFSSNADHAGISGLLSSGAGSGSGISGVAASGVRGESDAHLGVVGLTGSGQAGILGRNKSTANGTAGVLGIDGTNGTGISNVFSAGVHGDSNTHIGVIGTSNAFAVIGTLGVTGVQGELGTVREGHDFAVYSFGDVKFNGTMTATGSTQIQGNLSVNGSITAGTKDFKIDHPVDPKNKYLVHASIESDEMKDIYDGVATVNESGLAVVALPSWFEALNGSFRYQLTSIGTPQPGLYVAREIHENQFTIAGGLPGAKVSWQVSGVRKDAYARAHPLIVEETKDAIDRGHYLHPDAFGQPREEGIPALRDAGEDAETPK
jgi:hypothetical protein